MSGARDGGADAPILERLHEVIESRRGADPGRSYVASLLVGDGAAALAKIDEEAAELVDALAARGRGDVVHEAADLWFHVLVALARRGVGYREVLGELERRFGASGHDEKAARGKRGG